MQNEIVYQATVTTRGVTGTTETYVGLTALHQRAEQIFVETKGKEGRLFNFVEDHRKGQGIL